MTDLKTLLANENRLELAVRRRAKIVCTLGPSSNTEDEIRQLMLLGMDVARLNFSHGNHEEHLQRIRILRKVAASLGRTVCILQDLQGPKIRTGSLVNHTPVELVAGSRITITNKEIPGTAERLGTTFKTLAREAEIGSRILLSDGRLSLKVLKVEGEDVLCEVIDGGLLGEHQGINLPGAVLSVPSLTGKDRKDLAFGLAQNVDMVAISFVRSAADIRAVKKIIAAAGSDTPVIAKLEKPQAIENLEGNGTHNPEARHPAGFVLAQAGHYRYADAGLDDSESASHPRRGQRRSQRNLRWVGRSDALG
jgi:pyruvate kinase